MPDGATQEGELDEDGKLLLEDILPGAYRISYPEVEPDIDVDELEEIDQASGENEPGDVTVDAFDESDDYDDEGEQ